MSSNDTVNTIVVLNKIVRILAAGYAWQLGDMEQGQKAQHLSRCGFSNKEVAELLGMTTNAVNVALHRARKPGKRKSSKKKS